MAVAYASANPQMEYLLEGLAAEAQRQGHQHLHKAYLTALRSVQKYPMPLKNGEEAMMLEGIGPAIGRKLDQLLPRLQKEIDKKKKTSKSKASATQNSTSTMTVASRKRIRDRDASDENANGGTTTRASQGSTAEEPPSKRQRSRTYTPRYRSIPYAVMLALRKSSSSAPISKADLLAKAARFCDTSTAADKDDGTWKTAISTLVKKGLVQRHPLRTTPHYSLTGDGEELADRLSDLNKRSIQRSPDLSPELTSHTQRTDGQSLRPVAKSQHRSNSRHQTEALAMDKENRTESMQNSRWYENVKTLRADAQASGIIDLSTAPLSQYSPISGLLSPCGSGYGSPIRPSQRFSPFRSPSPRVPKVICKSPARLPYSPSRSPVPGLSSSEILPSRSQSSPAPTMPFKPSFRFSYVDENERSCNYKWEAACKVHQGYRYYRITTTQDPNIWDRHYRLLVSPFRRNTKSNYHRAWLREDDAPLCVSDSSSTFDDVKMSGRVVRDPEHTSAAATFAQLKKSGPTASRNLTKELESAAKRSKETLFAEDEHSTTATSMRGGSERVKAPSTLSKHTPTHKPPTVLPRKDFDVVMLVDTREIADKGNKEGKGRKTIFQELLKRRVPCEERSLALGDFLWIARHKRTGAEYVMDVIVERKKVDDLWASIKDGRYYEQKFRLARSGAERVVYIVEGSLSSSGNPHKTWNQLPVDTLESALVSTQVGNDFIVERCATLRETITFLQILNRQISTRTDPITIREHNDQEDEANDEEDESSEDESEQAITDVRGTTRKALWEIGRWSERMSKSGNLTLTDVFAKQLMQINGVSAAKAKAITDLYPTPCLLAVAYERLSGEHEREALLAHLTTAGRKLGPALSKRIYEAMWKRSTSS